MNTDAVAHIDPYLSSKEAGKLLGYTHDYISKLCREGKMAGIQRGRVWYVTEEEARAFQARHEAELEAKKAQLSQKFSAIRQEHEATRKQDVTEDEVAVAPVVAIERPVIEEVQEEVIASVPAQAPVYVKKSPEFVMPGRLLAAAVLALLLLIPSISNEFKASKPVTARSGAQTSNSLLGNLDEGAKAVLKADTELFAQTASVFASLRYLNDGYLQLAANAGDLLKGTYSTAKIVSDSYLQVYVMQGEIIYDSLRSIGGMGNAVLDGYEIVGESVLIGTQNAIDSYQSFFMVDSYIENLKKK